MLRRQLKVYDDRFLEAECAWDSEPSLPLAMSMLRWCKRIRDMFDAADGTHSDVTGYVDEQLALVPMRCRVDVLGHSELWSARVRLWRERFNGSLRQTTFENHIR